MKKADVFIHLIIIAALIAGGVTLIVNPSITNDRSLPLASSEMTAAITLGWFLAILGILWLTRLCISDKRWYRLEKKINKALRPR